MTELEAFDPRQLQDEEGNLDLGHAWAPPPSLTVAIVSDAFNDVPRPWLADVINFMAFGKRAELTAFGSFRHNPDFVPNGGVNFDNVGRRMRAAEALCAAGQLGIVKFIGSRIRHGDASDDIPARYFDTPRMLGCLDNSIGTNLHAAPMDEYIAAREGMHQEWWNVRAEKASFVEWLNGKLATPVAEKNKDPKATDDEIDAMIRGADAEYGRRVGGKLLRKIALSKGLRCTNEKLEDRAKRASRTAEPSVGRPRKIAPK